MGKCKNCYTEIPDDQVLCDNCNSKESYLDELLNSVVSTQSENTGNNRSIHQKRLKKRSKDSLNDSSEQMIHDEVNQNIPEYNENERETNMEKRDADDLQDILNMESNDLDPSILDQVGIESDNLNTVSSDPISLEQFEDVMSEDSGEDQSFDINNIFDFMDAVGDNSESVDWPSNTNDDDNNVNSNNDKNIIASAEESIKDNLDNDLGSNINNISVLDNQLDKKNEFDNYQNNTDNDVNNGDTSSLSLEDDILTEDSENINELLDFLSNEENAVSLDESNEFNSSSEMSDTNDILSFDNFSPEDIDSTFDFGSDIGDVFSDTLGAVRTLEDPVMDDLSTLVIPEVAEKDKEIKIKEKEKKRSIFKELMFGPEEDDLELEVLEEKKKKAKKDKKSKNKTKTASGKDENNEKKGFLDFLKKKKGNTTEKKAKAKKAVKPKKGKKEEEEVDLGKINKYATAIIFSIFVALAIVIISGTDIISYSSSINTASKEFNRQRYNYAYDAVHGVEIKDKDMELYDKVMTVMFVNKQLNSYNSFYSLGEYPRALDSLLKGLKRYDKYIDLAKELGIESDLNYVRDQILSELKSSYHLSEEEALDILKNEDQTTYSKKLYDVVNKSISLAEKGKE